MLRLGGARKAQTARDSAGTSAFRFGFWDWDRIRDWDWDWAWGCPCYVADTASKMMAFSRDLPPERQL